MIAVEDVAFAYPGTNVPVLAGLNFRLGAGSFTSLVGRNGCGKSTVAKLLNGLLLPQAGQVIVDGLNTAERAHLWEIRKAVQVVFQNPENQLVGGTVEEDIAFGLENLCLAWPEMAQRVDWALDFAGLRPLRSRLVSALSGGEKQQVALAGVLAMQPRCVILDEATSMLDDDGRETVMGLVRTMHRDLGLTVLQITQNLDETLESDRIIVLDDGCIVLDGPPEVVFVANEHLERLGLVLPAVVQLGRELTSAGVPGCALALNLSDLVKAICGSS